MECTRLDFEPLCCVDGVLYLYRCGVTLTTTKVEDLPDPSRATERGKGNKEYT